ncbi:MAG: DUF4190 domain-containing protein [Anaerolineales bacterium]|nr:DUF4190 domain-containing protein [Anaerolineales bacterium]
METKETSPSSPINRHSIISFALGVLTVLTFCGGFIIPIPFTSLLCAPASFVTGILALIYGIVSLSRIRKNNETGRSIAWAGILSGGFVFLCLLCMVLALISLLIFSPDILPPFLQNYQI